MTGTSVFLRQERADPVKLRTGAERWMRNSLIWRNSGPDFLFIPRKISGRIFTHHKGKESEELSEDEWGRRAVAAWYAILRYGITHGDTLEYC